MKRWTLTRGSRGSIRCFASKCSLRTCSDSCFQRARTSGGSGAISCKSDTGPELPAATRPSASSWTAHVTTPNRPISPPTSLKVVTACGRRIVNGSACCSFEATPLRLSGRPPSVSDSRLLSFSCRERCEPLGRRLVPPENVAFVVAAAFADGSLIEIDEKAPPSAFEKEADVDAAEVCRFRTERNFLSCIARTSKSTRSLPCACFACFFLSVDVVMCTRMTKPTSASARQKTCCHGRIRMYEMQMVPPSASR
mmetsp:Transcript_7552/g.19820  ORF Transcript_7552/g.19820 Transcript_7552/m.19820 type:complete len:253 (+) Transcript_7552:872-1630(+)